MSVFSANRGMYLEELINRTVEYYATANICTIEKRSVPIKILKLSDNGTIIGKIMSNSAADYFGHVNGRHIEFEAKETQMDNISLSRITQTQMECLINANAAGALSFLIVYFAKHDRFFLLRTSYLARLKEKNTKTISIVDANNNGVELEIEFPGILNLIKKM